MKSGVGCLERTMKMKMKKTSKNFLPKGAITDGAGRAMHRPKTWGKADLTAKASRREWKRERGSFI